MSRPKLDPVVTTRIVDLIRAGNYLEVAANAAGVHRTTLHRWLRLGRKQTRGRYRKFLNSTEKAQAEAESRDVALIAKAAADDWRAAAWRLERRSPRKYGPRVQISVHEELDTALERLKQGLDDPAYIRVLELLSKGDAASIDLAAPDAGGSEPAEEAAEPEA